MLWRDQPRRRAWTCAWLGLILTVLLRVIPAAANDPRGNPSVLSDPIDLTARRVAVWDAPDGRWIVLSGEAAAIQGLQGLRASSMVVRISRIELQGSEVHQAEVYAEGDVRSTIDRGAARKQGRIALRTSKEARVRSYEASGLLRLPTPPKRLAIIDRAAFPAPVPPQRAAVAPDEGLAPNPLPREVIEQANSANASQDPSLIEAQAIVPLENDQPPLTPAPASSPNPPSQPRRDPAVQRAQSTADGSVFEPDINLPPIDADLGLEVPDLRDDNTSPARPAPSVDDGDEVDPGLEPLPDEAEGEPAPRLEPLPDDETFGDEPIEPDQPEPLPDPDETAPAFRPPVMPGSQRVTSIYPRSGRQTDVQILAPTADGTRTVIYRGGVNVVSQSPQYGTVDLEADNAVIWRRPDPKKGEPITGPQGEVVEDADQPMEIYLEGNVIVRQDENKFAGKADQKTFRAERLFYDFVTDRIMAEAAEVDMFAPGLISPMKLKSPRIEQFRAVVRQADGSLVLSPDPEIRAERTISTGSRFPDPAYKIYNRSVTLSRKTTEATDENSGKPLRGFGELDRIQERVWRYDARTNFFYMGPVPIFYWPRFSGEIDDIDPPLRMLSFRTNNYFGQQLLSDWDGFKVFGLRRPNFIDNWNIDVDYLSARTKSFPALGSELGWLGNDLISDLRDPYRRNRQAPQTITHDYFGYFDIWGLRDHGIDVLGPGPAIVTNGPPGAGTAGFQRMGVPPFQDFRGRFNIRHMQRFLPDDEEHRFEDARIQAEAAYYSDRYFLEEYYKRLFDVGMDQETLLYGQWQKNNWAMSLWAEANLMDFRTDTQWLPRFDYYRLGRSFLGNRLVYFQHTGVNYANTHTDIMVNNPNLFAFLPFDPISNTSGVFSAGRGYTNHELDLPINVADVVRVVPYIQGQAVGWTDQIGGGPRLRQSTGAVGRIWGAAGVHLETTAWKAYPGVESELLNIHGLNNKISFFGDFRSAYSNRQLNTIAVQDDLDDNTYEMVRRYFAITSWADGLLPFPYDPRHLIVRRTLSPITDTTDVQATMDTLRFGIHQRLQTKRGPEGRRRIIDWMTLDASTTFFPNPVRDNFGKSWGQTTYNYEWFLGDRTSILSYGWFEFWDLIGGEPLDNFNVPTFNPKGLNVITTGISLARPPRGNVFIGYSVINTGPIDASALNVSTNYWMSPKWYGTFSTSYDFGTDRLLSSMFSLTRIGADYLLSLGLSVDPQRESYMFAFQISPRLAPTLRLGSGAGLNQFDSRLAPTQ